MGKPSQSEAIAFPSDGRNLPGHKAVEVVRTNCTFVFLSGKHAYKMKRDVGYDYLDFSTLQKRHEMLLRELALNAPTAPSIYRDLIAVTRDPAGKSHLGDVVDWVLRMHRFDANNELDKVIVQYHQQNEMCTNLFGADMIGAVQDELNMAFAAMTDHLDGAQIDQFHSINDRAYPMISTHLRYWLYFVLRQLRQRPPWHSCQWRLKYRHTDLESLSVPGR